MKTNVKSNLKTKILRFFQIVFVAIVCVTLTGCMGSDPDNPDTDTGGINIAGVKVLRKPLEGYDFDENVPETEGTTDFYYSLSRNIIRQLLRTYGNYNTEYDVKYDNIFDMYYQKTGNAQMGELADQFGTNPDGFVYFYDAIRYQISSVNKDAETQNYVVTADTSRAWNWSLPYYTSESDYPVLIYALNGKGEVSGDKISNEFINQGDTAEFSYEFFSNYYSGAEILGTDQFQPANFQTAYVNEDYINGLTYAIYSLVLGLQPNQMSVSYDSGLPVLTVEGYPATADQTSAERALEDVKILFNQLGSYVGLTERNKVAITNFVLDEIIGESAQVMPSLPSTYSYDLYYEDVVSAIVDYCGTLTTIGQANESTGEDETTVGESFIASEVVDYPYTSFFSSFEGDPFQHIDKPYEYQSFVIMPSKEVEITDIWLDFKYDAGKDGDLIYDESKFLDINVSVRWNKGDGSPVKVLTKFIRIYDGMYSFGAEGSFLEFELDLSEMEGGFGEVVKVGQFNCPEALIPNPLTQGRVIPINGFTDARRYYKVIESESYGGYGVLDESRIEGSYLEVAFDVVKQPGDTSTNYAFYTAISNLVEEAEWPGEPEWH